MIAVSNTPDVSIPMAFDPHVQADPLRDNRIGTDTVRPLGSTTVSRNAGVRPCKTGCGRLTWYESKQLCGICGRPNAKVCGRNDCTRVARPSGLCWKHELPEPKPTCSTPGCDRDVDSRGLCLMHYRRHRRAGTLPAVWVGRKR